MEGKKSSCGLHWDLHWFHTTVRHSSGHVLITILTAAGDSLAELASLRVREQLRSQEWSLTWFLSVKSTNIQKTYKKEMSILDCITHYLELYWQTRSFGDTSPLQDMSGNHKVAFPFCKSRKVHGRCRVDLDLPCGRGNHTPGLHAEELWEQSASFGKQLGGIYTRADIRAVTHWWLPLILTSLSSWGLVNANKKEFVHLSSEAEDGGRSSWVLRAHKT